MDKIGRGEGLAERIYWLIRLRWIAAAGAIVAVSFSRFSLKMSLPTVPLYALAILLGIYNFICLLVMHWVRRRGDIFLSRIANTQISLDLIILASLIHFSGGIENPFIFYFIFHMIIASILLSRRASFLQATLAIGLFCAMTGLEYSGVLPHYCLEGFISHCQYHNSIYIYGVAFVFITTLYIAVYMATSISSKLREREKSLAELNELLMEKDRMKSEYVLHVSHDIKEHLAAIQSCLEPVTKGLVGALNAGQEDLIRRAEDRTDKLLFFVKALLEISHIKLTKEIGMEYFSLKDTIENAVSFIETRAKEKNIAVNCVIDSGIDIIKGAQVYIEETVVNMLANSVKYTPQNGRIDIAVEGRTDGFVLIRLADTGIGIPKAEIPRIFDEFYRATNARKIERDGTGLGLSIAKQVIERHGGDIEVESEEGKGSIFTIRLPL